MYKATITIRSVSALGGEDTIVITSDDLNIFHAKVVGAVMGSTYGGTSVVTSVTTEEVEVAA